MVEYNKVNVKLSDTQLKKLKNAVENKTGTTLRISLKMFNGNNLPHELLLKLSKDQISKIIQYGEFLGSLLSKITGQLMKIAIPLGKRNYSCKKKKKKKKKMHGSGNTSVIISDEEMNYIIKMNIKGVTETIKMKQKNKKEDF